MNHRSPSSRLIIILSILVIVLAFAFYPLLNALDDVLHLPNWLYYGLDNLWEYGGVILAAILLWKMETKTIWHLTTPKKNTLLLGLHFILLFVWAIFNMTFLPAPSNGEAVGRMLDDAISTQNQWLFMVTVILIGPIREELVFRGLIFANLKKWNKDIISMLISAILFSLLHLPFNHLRVTDFLVYFMSGLVFAHFYKKTRSISWVILLHVIWNGFVYYMSTR